MNTNTRAVNHHNITVVGIDNRIHDPVPNASIRPSIETIIHRRVGAILIRQVPPRTANPKRVENAVDQPSFDPMAL